DRDVVAGNVDLEHAVLEIALLAERRQHLLILGGDLLSRSRQRDRDEIEKQRSDEYMTHDGSPELKYLPILYHFRALSRHLTEKPGGESGQTDKEDVRFGTQSSLYHGCSSRRHDERTRIRHERHDHSEHHGRRCAARSGRADVCPGTRTSRR